MYQLKCVHCSTTWVVISHITSNWNLLLLSWCLQPILFALFQKHDPYSVKVNSSLLHYEGMARKNSSRSNISSILLHSLGKSWTLSMIHWLDQWYSVKNKHFVVIFKHYTVDKECTSMKAFSWMNAYLEILRFIWRVTQFRHAQPEMYICCKSCPVRNVGRQISGSGNLLSACNPHSRNRYKWVQVGFALLQYVIKPFQVDSWLVWISLDLSLSRLSRLFCWFLQFLLRNHAGDPGSIPGGDTYFFSVS